MSEVDFITAFILI